MKKFVLAVAACIFAFAVGAAGKPTAFSVNVMPTKAVNIADQFAGILPNRPPVFPLVTKVVCGEPFNVEIVFFGAKVQDGKIRLAGKLVVTNPNGKKDEIPLKCEKFEAKGDTAGAFLFPQSLRVVYEPQDPLGKYVFEVELTDLNSGMSSKKSASVEYTARVAPGQDAEAFDKLAAYYRAPCPEYIVPAFREFLAGVPKQKEKEKKSFNPLPQLAFFYFVLKENPQCVADFARLFNSLHGEEKIMAGVVLNFVSEDAAKNLTADQRDAIRRKFVQNPFVVGDVRQAWQLDVCWAEFFVRGTKAPVMKVVNAMSLAKDSLTIEAYRKIAAPTPEDRRKLMNGLVVMAAQWSLGSLAKEHPLLRFYVEAALKRNEVKDPFAAALAAKTIGMKVRIQK